MAKGSSGFVNQREPDRKDRFFGEIYDVSNKYFKFPQRIIDDDNIIVVTKNVKIIKNSPVLITDNNKGIYLKDWQIEAISNYENGIYAYAVKLNRNHMKEYTFKSDFDGFHFDKHDSFETLKNVAEKQQKENMKFRKGWQKHMEPWE